MLALIQARMSSKRFPGKILKLLLDKPLLQWTIDRLKLSLEVDRIIVVTSDHRSDDPVEQFCKRSDVECFRGQLDNVAHRFCSAILKINRPGFVRICGDSPLIDPALVDRAIRLYRDTQCDLVTNIKKRTFPKGQSIEVINTAKFRQVIQRLKSPHDKEHVTRFYYDNSDEFKIIDFESGVEAGSIQMSVDTLEDFKKIKRLVSQLDGRKSGWQQLATILIK